MKELSVEKRKFFGSLARGKGRREHGLFTVEGARGVGEMLQAGGCRARALIATAEWLDSRKDIAGTGDFEVYRASKVDMERLSALKSSQEVVAVFELPLWEEPSAAELLASLTLALDDVQDPGNLGTIIRLADWWGVRHIVTSAATADCFNPKVVQSCMGALGRVRVVKTESLADFLKRARQAGVEVYGTFMNGENVYAAALSTPGVIVMGNEGNGISREVEALTTRRLTIPSFPPRGSHVESLNVATAAAIVLGQFRYGGRRG